MTKTMHRGYGVGARPSSPRALAALVLAAALSWVLGAPAAATAAPVSDIGVFQRIDAPMGTSGIRTTWDYVLEPLDAGCPMPEGTSDGVYVWQMTGDENRTIALPSAQAPGVYHYAMRQRRPAKAQPGYTLDDSVYEVSAYAADDGTVYAILCFTHDGASKVPDPGWTVTFEPQPAPGGKPAPGGILSGILGHLPQTGDITALVLMAAGACAVAGMLVIVVARRRRRDDDRDAQGR